MATQKELFVIDLIDVAKALTAAGMEQSPDIVTQWQSLGYASAGSDPIIDADLTNFNGLTAAQLNSFIGALNQLANYFTNTAVTTAAREAIFNDLKFVNFG
jgi:hypothetical protein